jgi:ABC-type transport system involved in cytochrome c biogenesis permease component
MILLTPRRLLVLGCPGLFSLGYTVGCLEASAACSIGMLLAGMLSLETKFEEETRL